MAKNPGPNGGESMEARMVPTGGVVLSEERLRLLAPQWEATYRGLRRMDELPLGETEPATLFVWEMEQP